MRSAAKNVNELSIGTTPTLNSRYRTNTCDTLIMCTYVVLHRYGLTMEMNRSKRKKKNERMNEAM